MNRRRQTKTLSSGDIRRLEEAKYNAEKLRLPLNCFLTFNPVRGGIAFTADPADLFSAVRNWTKVRLRRYGLEPTAIWTIENSPAGDCPHMHLLMHLPANHFADFQNAFYLNYPDGNNGGTVAHVRRDDGKTFMSDEGKFRSTFHYMTKQMDSRARHARSNRVSVVAPGPFVGKRFGMTANIYVTQAQIDEAKAAAVALRVA